MNDFKGINLEALARQCQNETQKFYQRKVYEEGYCYELLRRACQNQDDEALTHVYTLYLPILLSRARRHPAFSQSCQDVSAFARTAIAQFYQAAKGEHFLQKFPNLRQALAYLYTCLNSEILQDIRRNARNKPLPEDIFISPEVSNVDLKELWSYIKGLIPSENDQRLAYYSFVLEMKPAEIAERFPDQWKTQREVSVHLYKIRRTLRDDPYLRGLFGAGE